MNGRMRGLAILIVAVAIAWGVVAIGSAHASGWVTSLLGPARAAASPALAETLFDGIIYGPLLVVGLIAGVVERRNVLAAGARPGAWFGAGLLIGSVGLSAAVLDARLAGTLVPGAEGAPRIGLLLWGLGAVAFQTVAEEVYFRGWLQPALVRCWGAPAGLLAGAVAFALLHVAGGARAPVSLLTLFGGGLMFGLFALHGRGLAGAVGAHLAWNGAEQLVYGLDPNPGVVPFGALSDHELVGAALWGGSADGLNGSIGMAVVLLAIIVPFVLLGRGRLVPPTSAGAASART